MDERSTARAKTPWKSPTLHANDTPESGNPSPAASRTQDARSSEAPNVTAQGRSNRSARPTSSGSAPHAAAPARVCAFAVVRRVFEEGAYADQALHGEAGRLDLSPRDHALATRLAYGVVQRRDTLDHVIAALAGRPVGRPQPPPPGPPRP